MSLVNINGNDLVRSIKAGCIKLEHNRDSVDLLNVFPVPDGDTGTNMYLTLLSAVKEGEKNLNQPVSKVARAISMGSLMGARGNSGVILSQIFRGFARTLEGKETANALDVALALKSGAQTAYEAVMKPVEGTILTVIREIASACETEARKDSDIVATLLAGIAVGYTTLERTPSLLPILKEAGVVDAGGQGLIYFLEGAVEGLAQEKEIELGDYRDKIAPIVKDKVTRQDIKLEFQYCTEVLIKGLEMNTEDIKDHLRPLGDSMLVVGDDELVKVHIHSNHPGKVLETCLQWGQLSDIKINNMLEEIHEHINNWENAELTNTSKSKKPGLVAVGIGEGINEVLKSLGVDIVVEGGQTMNPSTEDLLNACNQVNAESVIIFPNNSNIIMAAQQVVELCDKKVVVVPTKSIMQAITALITYDPEGESEEIAAAMIEEMQQVKYAEVTHAVRDSSINGLTIKDGDIIGILGGEIKVTSSSPEDALLKLLELMVDDDSSLITYFFGDEINEDEASKVYNTIVERYSDCDVEYHFGGQPHYSYVISVE
ncbi:MAG: DAK2 domain-containing protein [Syntrophomonadaceae bacterium]|nr:DAK2 domain-containing protein [Syntrophomonadaceae bacterium]